MPRLLLAMVVGAVLTMAGCGGSDADGTTTTGTSGEDVAGTASSTTTAVEDDDGGATDAALVGQWTADGADTLTANLSNLGGVPGGVSCAGPITLIFDAAGTYSAGGEVTCTVGGVSLTASLMTTGAWEARAEGIVTLTGAVSEGGFDVPGIEIPPIDVVSDGEFEYTISGNVLTITFTDPPVGTVTQTWTRV